MVTNDLIEPLSWIAIARVEIAQMGIVTLIAVRQAAVERLMLSGLG